MVSNISNMENLDSSKLGPEGNQKLADPWYDSPPSRGFNLPGYRCASNQPMM